MFLFLIAIMMLLVICVSAYAENTSDSSQFPPGVIEIPQGTVIDIGDDDHTVTIFDCPSIIKENDTFVVYLQDLPIGYIARSVSQQENATIIDVEKADHSIFNGIKESGIIHLTPDMYEAIPAEGFVCEADVAVVPKGVPVESGTLNFGDLSFNKDEINFSKTIYGKQILISLSDMELAHDLSDGNQTIVFRGRWRISSKVLSESSSIVDQAIELIDDVPVGKIRIFGIGKLAIKVSLSLNAGCDQEFSGGFSIGFNTNGDKAGELINEFNVDTCDVETQTSTVSIEGALKVTAGIDILITEADLYWQLGMGTKFDSQVTIDQETKERTECDNFRVYLFNKVGAEVLFISPKSGKRSRLYSNQFDLPDEIAEPFSTDIHFENGQLVPGCSEGMQIDDKDFGPQITGFESDLDTERERVVLSDIELPCDLTIPRNLYINYGNLDLNGHTLTIEGDLMQYGGTLIVGTGKVIINGDYILQNENHPHGDSFGELVMTDNEGSIEINGDFIVQTQSPQEHLSAGTIYLKGNFYQHNAEDIHANFNSDEYFNLVMLADNPHIISFETAEDNHIGILTLENSLTVHGGLSVGIMDNNGHDVLINGDLKADHNVDLYDYPIMAEVKAIDQQTLTSNSAILSVPLYNNLDLGGYNLTVNGDMILDGDADLKGGTLTVAGSLYHHSGALNINGGKVDISKDYINVGVNSILEKENEQYYHPGEGALVMIYKADEMHVGRNFVMFSHSDHRDKLKAGTLYIGGDFTQLGDEDSDWYFHFSRYNFAAETGHKTILNGTKEQTISFESGYAGFGTLESTNNSLVFKDNVNWQRRNSMRFRRESSYQYARASTDY